MARQVIGFLTNFKARRNTLAHGVGNSDFGLECMSPRPALVIELSRESIQPLHDRMRDIFANYHDDSYDLFSKQKNWDSRLRKIRLLEVNKASSELPFSAKYLVMDFTKNPEVP